MNVSPTRVSPAKVSMKEQLEVLAVCYDEADLDVYHLALRFPDLPIVTIAEIYLLAQGKGEQALPVLEGQAA
jgi:hypothetical protein